MWPGKYGKEQHQADVEASFQTGNLKENLRVNYETFLMV